MKCTTVLHGGVCYRTSTPHKSENEMREKKKIKYFNKVVKPLHGKQSKNNDYLAFEPLYSKS